VIGGGCRWMADDRGPEIVVEMNFLSFGVGRCVYAVC
jgi:hypothetical protein